MSKNYNRDGNFKNCTDFSMPKMGDGPKLGNVGCNKLEGGLKKGAAGVPTIKKTK